MMTTIDIKPIFGPRAADDATVLLPALPAGLTSPLEVAISSYRAAFISDDDDGEGAAERMREAAHQIAGMPAIAHADIAAKLIIGLHESHPGKIGDQLALDAASFETDASGRILMSVLDDLIGLATPQLRADREAWEKVEAEYRTAWALWDELPDPYTNEESDAVGAIAFPAMQRMMDTPAPDAAAMLVKMIAASEGSRIVTADDMDVLIADAQRFATGPREP